jgi:hypothetical protein
MPVSILVRGLGMTLRYTAEPAKAGLPALTFVPAKQFADLAGEGVSVYEESVRWNFNFERIRELDRLHEGDRTQGFGTGPNFMSQASDS